MLHGTKFVDSAVFDTDFCRRGTTTITATQDGISGTTTLTTAPAAAGKIAFVSTRDDDVYEIYVMNTDGSSQTRITSAVEPYIGGGLTFYYANWSPDGNAITGETHWSAPSEGDAAGTQFTHNADDHNAMSSPDGTQITFYRLNSGTNTTGADIYLMSDAGETKLVEGINPIWSPDGSKIAFIRDDNGFKLYVMNSDSGAKSSVGPMWSPQ